MEKEDIDIAKSFMTFEEIYDQLIIGNYSVIFRKAGSNEYPEIRWMINYFTAKEEYEKCTELQKIELKLSVPSEAVIAIEKRKIKEKNL